LTAFTPREHEITTVVCRAPAAPCARQPRLAWLLDALVPRDRSPTQRRRAAVPALLTMAGLLTACAVPTPPLAPVAAPLEVIVRTAADTAATTALVTAQLSAAGEAFVLTHAGNGRYTGTLPDSAREFTLTVLVPEHVRLNTTLMRPAGARSRFTLRLRPLIPRTVVENPRVIGDFNDFAVGTAVPLTAGSDGVLRAAIPFRGDSSRIQVLGIGSGGRGAWMPVRSWALSPALPDASASWAGVLTPRHDTLRIAVDTARRTPDVRAPTITTEPLDSTASIVNQLRLARNDAWASEQALREWQPDRKTGIRMQVVTGARATMTASTDGVVRAHALVTLLAMSPLPHPQVRADSRQFFASIAPGSQITHDRDGLRAVDIALVFSTPDSGAPARDTVAWRRQVAERSRAYFLPVARSAVVDSTLRKSAWLDMMYLLDAIRDDGIDSYIDEAISAYPQDPILGALPQSMGRRRVLREGAAFPAFRLTSIGEPATEITNATFAGTLTLVDFWGTWCGPCIVEMPFLHRTHERFRDRGFTIFSIASEESVDVVRTFRAGQWKMPWLNAWTEGSGNSRALSALGVMHFPMAVLVGPDGIVIAIDTGLRGEDLARTVERHLPR